MQIKRESARRLYQLRLWRNGRDPLPIHNQGIGRLRYWLSATIQKARVMEIIQHFVCHLMPVEQGKIVYALE